MARFGLLAIVICAAALSPQTAPAQSKTPTADNKAAVTPTPAIPDDYRLNLLIRTTIIALNQANVTGNYSVLRDLAAPGFQSTNNSTKLGEIFAELRRRNFDLSPILFVDPKLVRPAAIEPNGMLRLSGFIPTRPQQVDFDMMFQFVGGAWRLFGLAVDTRTVVDAPSSSSGDASSSTNAKPSPTAAKPPPVGADAKSPAVSETLGKEKPSAAATTKDAAPTDKKSPSPPAQNPSQAPNKPQ